MRSIPRSPCALSVRTVILRSIAAAAALTGALLQPATGLAWEIGAARKVEAQSPTDPGGNSDVSPANQVLVREDRRALLVVPAIPLAPSGLQVGFRAIINEPIDEHGNRLLHLASRSGDLGALDQLLTLGATPGVRNHFGRTPLDVAFRYNAQGYECIRRALTPPRQSVSDILFRRDQAERSMVN